MQFICWGLLWSSVFSLKTLALPSDSIEPQAANKENYDNKFDNINIDEILSQARLLNNYIKCLEDLGPCTPDGKLLKETLPDAIATDCAKCTQRQKYGSDKVTHHLIDNRLQDWLRLEKIYDPEGTYRQNYLRQKNNATQINNMAEN